MTTLLPFLLLAAAAGALFIEAALLRRRVSSIPVRIHVNGTRGKSSVVRYIAAGLRSAGVRTVSKVTGVVPTYCSLNGEESVIRRFGPARVQEQFMALRRAAAEGAGAAVIECMSLQPEYQELEARWLRPTVSVLTNVRDDHREVMGETEQERIRSLTSAVQPGVTVVTGEERLLDALHAAVRVRGARLVSAPLHNGAGTDTAAQRNIGIAVAACSAAGFPAEKVLPGILQEAERDRLRRLHRATGGSTSLFIDVFEANDVESTAERFAAERRSAPYRSVTIILNTRHDRPVRTADFVRWILTLGTEVRSVVLSGTHSAAAERMLRSGRCRAFVVRCEPDEWSEVRGEAVPVGGERMIVGVGNIAGAGHRWRSVFSGGPA